MTIKNVYMRNFGSHCLMEGEFPSVDAGDSTNFSIGLIYNNLDGFSDGIVEFVNFSCDSTNYSISFHTEPSCEADVVTEFIKIIEIERSVVASGLNAYFANSEDLHEKNLFVKILNESLMSTGIIKWSIGLLIHKRTARI